MLSARLLEAEGVFALLHYLRYVIQLPEMPKHRGELCGSQHSFDLSTGTDDNDRFSMTCGLEHLHQDYQDADAAGTHLLNAGKVEHNLIELQEFPGMKQRLILGQVFVEFVCTVSELAFKYDQKKAAPGFQTTFHVIGHYSHHLGRYIRKGNLFIKFFPTL